MISKVRFQNLVQNKPEYTFRIIQNNMNLFKKLLEILS